MTFKEKYMARTHKLFDSLGGLTINVKNDKDCIFCKRGGNIMSLGTDTAF